MVKYVWVLVFMAMASTAWSQVRIGAGAGSTNVPLDYANPKQYEIGGITVSGAENLDPNTLISITGLKVGDKITVPGEDLSNALRKLWDQGILGDVGVSAARVEGNQIFLDFYVKERPRMSRFSFSGIKKSQATELRDKIKLIRGKVVTDALLNTTRTAVRKYYLEKGYMNPQIAISQRADSLLSNSVVLDIKVDPGRKVKIEEIVFEGNEAISDAKLKRQMKKTKEKRLRNIFTGSKFVPSQFEEDKKLVIDHYNSEGFRDAQIVSDSIYALSDNRIGIKLKVDEGNKYYFRDISWTGNYIHKDEVLDQVLGIQSGDTYSRAKLDKNLSGNPNGFDVTTLYMDDGYLFFRVEPVEVLVEGDSIDLEIQIVEGPQANIRNVSVAGNTKTSDHVILRELRTIPGQKFSRTQLIRSQREIAALGYFDPEQIGINPIPNEADGTVDINYTVVEKPNDQITLSGGWGGPFGAVGTVGLILNNFSLRKATSLSEWRPIPSGDGQRLALNIQANGRQYQSYSLSFTEPWLGGRKPNSLTVSLTKNVIRDFNYYTREFRGGSMINNGASVNLGRRLAWPDDYFTLMNSLSYFQYKMENFGQFGSQLFPGGTGTANNVSFVTNFARNSLDINPQYPKSGSMVGLTVSLTPPYSLFKETPSREWVEFHKWMFDASWFVNLAGNLVLNTRSHLGFIGSYSKNAQIGPFERFTLGGNGLGGQGNFMVGRDFIGLRGYDDQSLNGQRPGETANQGPGGVAFTKFVTELRYPVTLNPSATVFVLAFAEAGNNFGSYQNYNPFKLYRSVGIGARVFMAAFGLLGFDYGYGLDTLPGGSGKRGQFHFMIGQQIR
jgi:outer membrane protein insertion porin family